MSAPVLRYATVCTVDNDPLKTILRLAHANAGILLWQAEADALKAYLSNDCPEDDTVFCSSLYYDAALQELAVLRLCSRISRSIRASVCTLHWCLHAARAAEMPSILKVAWSV